MSLNQRFAMDQKKVRRFGKFFGSIDFEMNHNLSNEVIRQRRKDTVIGSFLIGGKEFELTLEEVDRISETMEAAKEVYRKNFIMGKY